MGIDFLGITASAAVFVLRIDAVHIAVGEGFVNRLFDRVGRRRALHPGGIAAQRGGADQAVHHIKTISTQVTAVAGRLGSFSIQAESGGKKILNHATAAKPQKKQYSRLTRPPRLNGMWL